MSLVNLKELSAEDRDDFLWGLEQRNARRRAPRITSPSGPRQTEMQEMTEQEHADAIFLNDIALTRARRQEEDRREQQETIDRGLGLSSESRLKVKALVDELTAKEGKLPDDTSAEETSAKPSARKAARGTASKVSRKAK